MQTIPIEDDLMSKAVQKTGISNRKLIVEAGVQLLIAMANKQPDIIALLEDMEDIQDAEAVLSRNEPSISLADLRKELGLEN
ncbi:hypothetical protein [Candidatus Venteria ishoeyi]|uniref:Uncharacterized protein n=1 Tax=Candidatus Venteria ishoeyi TaxID=1899563 RepID=A0A1H6FE51_9GAMM|nr:hypothetical protein [Candidatus Venteria ishoeyi]MDM8545881.1 hypothetical protein [Candidatus Venteria ishoeyi]SEH08342.1 Uncharacterised protein [Candidatus Venteria ishoeyi]